MDSVPVRKRPGLKFHRLVAMEPLEVACKQPLREREGWQCTFVEPRPDELCRKCYKEKEEEEAPVAQADAA